MNTRFGPNALTETPPINRDHPVVVIGGGLMGVTVAYELSQRGYSVTLLEAGDRIACGASHANGGMLTPSEAAPWNGPGVGRHLLTSLFSPASTIKMHWTSIPELTRWGLSFLNHSRPGPHRLATRANHRLAHYSVERTRSLTDQLKLSFGESRQGTMCIYRSAKRLDTVARSIETLADQGQQMERLDREGVIRVEPQLGRATDDIAGGLYFPDDGSGNAREFTLQLAERAKAHGAIIRTGVRVTGLLVRDERLVGVETSEEKIETPTVVVAAGVLSPDLIRPAGLKLPVKPAKGYSLSLNMDRLGNEAPAIPVVDDAAHVAVSPIGDVLRVVGMAEFCGHDARVDPRRVAQLRRFFAGLYPHLEDRIDWNDAQPWTGLRPMSADGRPFIGPSPVKGLWINCGHGHLGWTMAAGSAALLADQMTGQPPAINPDPYRPDRKT